MAASSARALRLGAHAGTIAAVPARARPVVYAGGRQKRAPRQHQRKAEDQGEVNLWPSAFSLPPPQVLPVAAEVTLTRHSDLPPQ